MIIVNDLGHHCPPALLTAAQRSQSKPLKHTIRVSELIDSPLIRFLKLKHWNDIKYPVSRCIASLRGTAWHTLMERNAPPKDMSEHRFFRYYPEADLLLTGQPDNYDHEEQGLFDYKQCATWKYVAGDFGQWTGQQNIYKGFLTREGFPVKKITIYADIKDFSEMKALGNKDLPQKQALAIPLQVWSQEEIEDYIQTRMDLHVNHPEEMCSEEERWTEPTTYALMKEGRKSAVRVMDTREELVKYATEKKHDLSTAKFNIVKREGCDKRCDKWCEVRAFCPYKKETP